MKFEELLKSLGIEDDKIKAITEGMKKNKIFTASEENLDVRYGKLKADHEALKKQHGESETLIADLQGKTKDNEAVQTKITEYESTIKTLKEEAQKAKVESELKISLLASGAKASDIDYLMFKMENDSDWKPELDDSGKVKGLDDKVKGLKTQFPSQFESSSGKKIDEKKLPEPDSNDKVTIDQFKRMGYRERNNLFNEDPDLYRKLSGQKGE